MNASLDGSHFKNFVFKVNSKRANQFRKWADGIVKEYTIDCILDKGKIC